MARPSPLSLKTPRLLLLTGPVGVGKSTSAQAAARHLRAGGLAVACVDLDQLYCMVRQSEGFGDPSTWRLARQTAALLAESFFNRVADVVIVEGGFLTQAELDDLTDALRSRPKLKFVSLHGSYETVHARVMADTDPGRVASKVPAILRGLYAEYQQALPFLLKATTCVQLDHLDPTRVGWELAALMTTD